MDFFRQLSLIEKIVFFGAFLSFIASTTTYFYFDQIFFKPLIHAEDIIGDLRKKAGNVSRKTPDMFEFASIYVQDPLGNGDSVLTDPGATAAVHLNNESVIHVAPESLVVFREKDGEFNIKIEKGKVSADISKDSKIEFQTDEEAINVDGKEFNSLEISYKEEVGIEVSDLVPRKVSETVTDKQEEALPRKPSSTSVKSSSRNSKTNSNDKIPDQSKEPLLPKNFKNKQLALVKPESVFKKKYQAPYPSEGQTFLHKGPASIVVFPKNKCQQLCRVEVTLPGQKPVIRTFEPDRLPILTIPIVRDFSNRIQWKIVEGSESNTGSFEVRPFNSEEFKKALSAGKNIEVLD